MEYIYIYYSICGAPMPIYCDHNDIDKFYLYSLPFLLLLQIQFHRFGCRQSLPEHAQTYSMIMIFLIYDWYYYHYDYMRARARANMCKIVIIFQPASATSTKFNAQKCHFVACHIVRSFTSFNLMRIFIIINHIIAFVLVRHSSMIHDSKEPMSLLLLLSV